MATFVKSDVFKSSAVSEFYNSVNTRTMVLVSLTKGVVKPQDDVVLQRKRRKRCKGLLVSTRLKGVSFIFALLFVLSLNAQVPINGTISGTCSKPCYSTQYDSVTQSMTQLPFEVASFPNWEVWTKNGYVYVIRKCKQSFLEEIFSYADYNCVVLQLPNVVPKEELVAR